MPKFSPVSAKKLASAHPDLQKVFNEVIKHWDCSILEGHRGEADQNEYFKTGKSKLKWPSSKHNSLPSKAVDAMPSPISWEDREGICYFAGFVLGIASSMGIKIRWGGDFNQNRKIKDEKFVDMPHFELVD